MTRPVPFPIRIDPQTRSRLEELAAAEGRTLSNFIGSVIQSRISGGPEAGERYHYTRQKFWQAVDCLVGSGALSARLGFAFNYLLVLKAAADLPPSMHTKFEELMESLDRHAVRSNTHPLRVEMPDLEAARTAETIFAMHTELKGGI